MIALDAVIGVLLLGALLLLVLYVRRAVITRGRGSFEMSYRLDTTTTGRGWALGFGKYVGDDLAWYRVFSFSVRPSRSLSRNQPLEVFDRRMPGGQESLALQSNMVVLRCHGEANHLIEIAMSEPAVTGFLAWLEASAPGSSLGPGLTR